MTGAKPPGTLQGRVWRERCFLRAELVVIDDIGLSPVATDAAEGLYRVTSLDYQAKPNGS